MPTASPSTTTRSTPGVAGCLASAGDVREYDKSTASWANVENPSSSGYDIEHVTVERTDADLKLEVYLAGDAPLTSELAPGDMAVWNVYLYTASSRPKHWKALYTAHVTRSRSETGSTSDEATFTDEIGYGTSNYEPEQIPQGKVRLDGRRLTVTIANKHLPRLGSTFRFGAHSEFLNGASGTDWVDACPAEDDPTKPSSAADFPNDDASFTPTTRPTAPTTSTAVPPPGDPGAAEALAAFNELKASACTQQPQASQIPPAVSADHPGTTGNAIITDAEGNQLFFARSDGTVTSADGPEAELPWQYTFGCDPEVFVGTWD